MVEIVDQISARAWLDEQGYQTQVWFATRCALRAAPALRDIPATASYDTILTHLRALITSAAVATCPLDQLHYLATPSISAVSAFDTIEQSSIASASVTAALASLSIGHALRCAASAADAAEHAARALAECETAVAYILDPSGPSVIGNIGSKEVFLASQSDAVNPGTWPILWPQKEMPPMLHDKWPPFLRTPHRFFSEKTGAWAFWNEWYGAIATGDPLPWHLSFRIITELSDDDWSAGPYHVATCIARIRSAFDLAEAMERLTNDHAIAKTDAFLAGFGHNNPPELIHDSGLVTGFQHMQSALQTLEDEATSPTPDKQIAATALRIIADWFNATCRYLGRKLDLAIDTTIKWGIPAAGGYLILNPDKLQSVIELGKRWLGM